MVVTETWGGTISGYCAIGIENSARKPAMVVTIAMTIASRGRSTKMAENIGSAPLERRRHRASLDRRSGAHPLQSFDDDLLAPGQAFLDDRIRSALTPRLDPFHDGLAVLDHEDIDAFLIGDQGRLRDDQHLLGGAAFERYPYQLAIGQSAGRIGKSGAHQHGIGGAIDRHVDEIDLAGLVVGRAVGKTKPGLD